MIKGTRLKIGHADISHYNEVYLISSAFIHGYEKVPLSVWLR